MMRKEVVDDLQERLDKINQIQNLEETKEMLADLAENVAFFWNELYNITDVLNQLFPDK